MRFCFPSKKTPTLFQEPRLNLTDLFNALEVYNPNINDTGIDLTEFFVDGLDIWRPEIHFIDAVEVDSLATSVIMQEDGYILFSQHLVLTIVQPLFNYVTYPLVISPRHLPIYYIYLL